VLLKHARDTNRGSAGRIAEILNEKRSISADTALRLSRDFGMSAEMWMNMHADYELAQARDELAEIIEHGGRPRAA
jgi:plasmid maintenance system antidote protein VapI